MQCHYTLCRNFKKIITELRIHLIEEFQVFEFKKNPLIIRTNDTYESKIGWISGTCYTSNKKLR